MEELKKLVRRDWHHLIGIILFFAVMVSGGYFLQDSNPQLTQLFQKTYFEHLKQIVALMKGQSVWIKIVVIWFNNLFASFSAIFLGMFSLGIFPLMALISNGMGMGIMQRLVEHQGLGTARFYLALLPHGIFELPGFFIAVGLGIRLGIIPIRLIIYSFWRPEKLGEIALSYRSFFHELRYYLGLIVLLLFVAAVFEITVSPMMLK